LKPLFFFKDFSNQLIERPVSFSRHAREGGHPVFSAEHFWIPAFQAVLKFLLVIASDRRERGNLYVFNAL
jgi:hypothetical protein